MLLITFLCVHAPLLVRIIVCSLVLIILLLCIFFFVYILRSIVVIILYIIAQITVRILLSIILLFIVDMIVPMIASMRLPFMCYYCDYDCVFLWCVFLRCACCAYSVVYGCDCYCDEYLCFIFMLISLPQDCAFILLMRACMIVLSFCNG